RAGGVKLFIQLIQIRTYQPLRFFREHRFGAVNQLGNVVGRSRLQDLLPSAGRKHDGEVGDDHAPKHSLGRAEQAANLPVELAQLDSVDGLRNEPEAEPDDGRGAQVEHQHGEVNVPVCVAAQVRGQL